jgi:hypothetical protein
MNPRVAEHLDPTHDIRPAQPWEAFMANEEHVARLKQGVDAWNKWRSETSYLRPYYIQAVSFRSQAFLEETEEQRWSYSVRIELEERLKELQERLRVGLSGVVPPAVCETPDCMLRGQCRG